MQHTPESLMRELAQCKTEVGQQVEALRSELQDHKNSFDSMLEDWEQFKKDFDELLNIFRSARGFFKVLGWIGKGVRWLVMVGVAVSAIIAAIKSGGFK